MDHEVKIVHSKNEASKFIWIWIDGAYIKIGWTPIAKPLFSRVPLIEESHFYLSFFLSFSQVNLSMIQQ